MFADFAERPTPAIRFRQQRLFRLTESIPNFRSSVCPQRGVDGMVALGPPDPTASLAKVGAANDRSIKSDRALTTCTPVHAGCSEPRVTGGLRRRS